jgi:DegV family protein with EDD domain
VPLLSSAISGTIASALSAEQECTDAPLEVVDTKETAAGLALVVIAVVEAVEAGKDLAEVRQIAEKVASQVKFTFMVDTLEYLHKGGRIGGGKRFLGTALRIKPILVLDDEGKIEALEQVRTNRKAMERLVQIAAEQAGGKPAHVGVIHANAPDAAEEFKKMLEAEVDCKYLEIFGLSPVIGVHVGPGALGCAIYPDLD